MGTSESDFAGSFTSSTARTVRCTQASQVVPQPWRNGGGRTRELLAWPSTEDWDVRVSLADIDRDGPFSSFPGVTRWFAVVEGAGVVLSFGGREERIVAGDGPFRFDAAEALACRLLDGATRDLNLMLRHGAGVMRRAESAQPWHETFAMRGLFSAVAGRWAGAGESRHVSRQTLLWADAPGDRTPWTFVADEPASSVAGWWLGYTPAGDRR